MTIQSDPVPSDLTRETAPALGDEPDERMNPPSAETEKNMADWITREQRPAATSERFISYRHPDNFNARFIQSVNLDLPDYAVDIKLEWRTDREQRLAALSEANGTTHELKTDPEVFQATKSGTKTCEICRNDRDFKVGDELWLRETKFTGAQMHMRPEQCPLIYTGREERRIVSHVLTDYGLSDGWCCLSLGADREQQPAATTGPGAGCDVFGGCPEYCRCGQRPAALSEACSVPPEGWACSRAKEHEGPCAASPEGPTTKEWCKDYPASAAWIINNLAQRIDAGADRERDKPVSCTFDPNTCEKPYCGRCWEKPDRERAITGEPVAILHVQREHHDSEENACENPEGWLSYRVSQNVGIANLGLAEGKYPLFLTGETSRDVAAEGGSPAPIRSTRKTQGSES